MTELLLSAVLAAAPGQPACRPPESEPAAIKAIYEKIHERGAAVADKMPELLELVPSNAKMVMGNADGPATYDAPGIGKVTEEVTAIWTVIQYDVTKDIVSAMPERERAQVKFMHTIVYPAGRYRKKEYIRTHIFDATVSGGLYLSRVIQGFDGDLRGETLPPSHESVKLLWPRIKSEIYCQTARLLPPGAIVASL